MKVSLALAAALLFPIIVNAQNGNSTSVNVSGACPTIPNLRLTDSSLGPSWRRWSAGVQPVELHCE